MHICSQTPGSVAIPQCFSERPFLIPNESVNNNYYGNNKTPANIIETFPHSLQWRKVLYISGWQLCLAFTVNQNSFSSCIVRDFAWSQHCAIYLVLCSEWCHWLECLCQCFSLWIELFAFRTMPSVCMAILLSACLISQVKVSPITYCVVRLLELGKLKANLILLMVELMADGN